MFKHKKVVPCFKSQYLELIALISDELDKTNKEVQSPELTRLILKVKFLQDQERQGVIPKCGIKKESKLKTLFKFTQHTITMSNLNLFLIVIAVAIIF